MAGATGVACDVIVSLNAWELCDPRDAFDKLRGGSLDTRRDAGATRISPREVDYGLQVVGLGKQINQMNALDSITYR